MTNNSLYYIWLSEAIGGSYDTYRELTDTIGSVYDVYMADTDVYSGLSARVRRRMSALCDKSLSRAMSISDFCRTSEVCIITYEDKNYPSLLRDIEDPPLVLYIRGRMPDFESKLHVAVVGTRKMTEYGKNIAYNMGYSLSRNGAVVVSGMALGCDSVAMCAALDAGCGCIGVLGCGVDIAYPPQHSSFMKNILSNGGSIISEYAPGVKAKPEYFVRRNRIISGLCRATLVVEADMISGAMHTARFTNAQDRMLFVIPGKVGEKSSEGTLSLISDGARVALEPNDILKEYVFLYSGTVDLKTYGATPSGEIDACLSRRGVYSKSIAANSIRAASDTAQTQENKVQKRIGIRDVLGELVKKKTSEPYTDPQKQKKLELLPKEVRDVYDKIPKNEIFIADDVEKYGISAREFMCAVTILEINGLAKAYPGSRYTLE